MPYLQMLLLVNVILLSCGVPVVAELAPTRERWNRLSISIYETRIHFHISLNNFVLSSYVIVKLNILLLKRQIHQCMSSGVDRNCDNHLSKWKHALNGKHEMSGEHDSTAGEFRGKQEG